MPFLLASSMRPGQGRTNWRQKEEQTIRFYSTLHIWRTHRGSARRASVETRDWQWFLRMRCAAGSGRARMQRENVLGSADKAGFETGLFVHGASVLVYITQ
jgi:hypothetical protein